jgi:hypothetical protein
MPIVAAQWGIRCFLLLQIIPDLVRTAPLSYIHIRAGAARFFGIKHKKQRLFPHL